MPLDNTRRSILILLGLLLSDQAIPLLWQPFGRLLPPLLVESTLLRGLVYSSLVLLPILAVLALLYPPREWAQRLGLADRFRPALLLAVAATVPMFVGNALLGTLHFDLDELFMGSLRPGLVEEIVFRGFLFGLLYRECGWKFLPAALISSFFFGISHAYQGEDLAGALVAVAFAGVGALWFAWLYVDFGFNLWLPIGLHVLMNASVSLFQIEGGVALGPMSNLFRFVTIGLAIYLARRFRPEVPESKPSDQLTPGANQPNEVPHGKAGA